ncbi:UPF0042 nucleotide-binding protein [Nocardioides daedukensis]|uniref:UPF0042 nucleotide-binding protein n=1 Tax=Nocardioides daedukensis TaxID=634462 RepID=A0A7Y9RZP5_9ACTN|nr:RNase adapter RapZ [Nocardioides daedukensis]NYG57767.1 UPF0042 nucleotide-binding protein [Nocardioides daedukensis]
MSTPEPDQRAGELVVVTGMTGAGRSTAAKELEDLGYFVVDNLPPSLLPDIVHLVNEDSGTDQPIAVVVDVRSGAFFETLRANIEQKAISRRTTLLFLEADDDVLVRRQDAARRPHPLQEGGRLLDGLQRERVVLAPLRGTADVLVDTSNLNVHQLASKIAEHFGTPEAMTLKITVVSFGFKYGIPVDADFMADMRFLPNPYWEPDLRAMNGTDPDVSDYVITRPDAQQFIDQFVPVIATAAAGYLREGKRFLTVAIGCTGGKHRSVAMSEAVAARLREQGYDARAQHRDLGNE